MIDPNQFDIITSSDGWLSYRCDGNETTATRVVFVRTPEYANEMMLLRWQAECFFDVHGTMRDEDRVQPRAAERMTFYCEPFNYIGKRGPQKKSSKGSPEPATETTAPGVTRHTLR